MSEHFSLSDCDVIGFDLDHTLCRYRLQESCKLIYHSFAQYLVAEKGYKEDLLTVTAEEWDFCSKGLVLDLEEGNFLKLAADGTILRACHGTKTMTAEMIEEVYGEKREWKHFKTINGTYARSAKYYFYDNYFDLPGALLCAKIVDSLEMTDGQKKYDFWKDVISAIEYNYKTSAYKDPGVIFRLSSSQAAPADVSDTDYGQPLNNASSEPNKSSDDPSTCLSAMSSSSMVLPLASIDTTTAAGLVTLFKTKLHERRKEPPFIWQFLWKVSPLS